MRILLSDLDMHSLWLHHIANEHFLCQAGQYLVYCAQVTYNDLQMLKQHSEGSVFTYPESFQELAELEIALQEQHEVNATLQHTQGELSAYEAELETQLKLRDAEASQLKEDLEKLTRLSQVSRGIQPSRRQIVYGLNLSAFL